MKVTLLAAAAALGPVTAAAHAASEGDDPFLFHAPGPTGAADPATPVDTGSVAYPDLTGRPTRVVAAGGPDAAPATGGEGTVQTANSLPRGFAQGTVAYARARSVQRHSVQQVAAPTRIARTAQVPGGKPRG